MKLIGLLLSVAVLAQGVPVSQDDSVFRLVASNFVDCANSDLSLCLKEHALRATERLGTVRKLKLTDGITIFNSNPKEARSLDSLPADPEERNKQVTERLWEKASDLLTKSELELSFAGNDDDDTESRAMSNEVEEGRKKKKKEVKKKLKMLIPLVLLAKAKAVALVVFSIVLIAVSIAKLALLAKIAFLFKAISAVKQLLAKKNQHEEVEHGWAPPPEEHGQGWEGGWSRSKKDATHMAYSAYRK